MEDRRSDLRQRYTDVLVELGERYAQPGDRTAGAGCLRPAKSLSDEDVPRISEALSRLTVPVPVEPA